MDKITVVCHKDHDKGYEDFQGKCLLCVVDELMVEIGDLLIQKCTAEEGREWVGLADEEELHLQAAGYANRRKEAYLDRMKQGSVEKLNQKMIDWLWVAHYEGWRDAIRARGSP